MERDASYRIAISGLLSGSVTTRHSGCHSIKTIIRAQIKRSVSRPAVRLGLAERLTAVKQSNMIIASAIELIPKVVGDGEKVKLEIEKFKILDL